MPLNWRVWCVGVCLPMCGLLRILVDVLCWCVRPSNVRSRSGLPCSPLLGHPLRGLLPSVVGGYCAGRSICASSAPLGVYIYAFGGESCTTRHPLLRSARQDPDRDRAWHPREFGAVLGGSASLTLPAPPLPSSSRRYAPQCFVAGIPASRLATCLTAHPTNRVGACRSVRHSLPRPLPHLP